MLVSQSKELLKIAWKPYPGENKVYYIKPIFETQSYSILVTDLKYVWFERCSFDAIVEKAKKQRIDVGTESQVEKLIGYFKKSFEHNLTFVPLDEKLELHCGYEMGIMKLNWVFDCLLLKYQTNNPCEISGPDVLYQHLILPSQFIINNSSKEDDSKNTSKAFTQKSLDLIASILEDQFTEKSDETVTVKNEDTIIKQEVIGKEQSPVDKEEQRKRSVQEELERTIREQAMRLQSRKKRRIL